MSNFVKDTFSRDGQGSAKRVLGGLIIAVILALLAYAVIKAGGFTEITKDIAIAMMFVACALLGIEAVMSPFSKTTVIQTPPTQPDNDTAS